jgi:hypothetical protein
MKRLVSVVLELDEKSLITSVNPVVGPSSSLLTSPATTDTDLVIEDFLETEEDIDIPPFWEEIGNDSTRRVISSKWLSFLLICVQWQMCGMQRRFAPWARGTMWS